MSVPDKTLYARNDDEMEDYGDIGAYDDSLEEEYEEEEEEEMGEPSSLTPRGGSMSTVPAIAPSKPPVPARKAAPKKKAAKKKAGKKKSGKKAKSRRGHKKAAKKRGKKKAAKKKKGGRGRR